MKKKQNQDRLNAKDVASLKKTVCIIIGCLIFTWWISKDFFQLMLIQGNSMEPSYHNWQFVIVNKYDHMYKIGDVVAFNCKGTKSILVKRIVGCPGDIMEIREGTLFVNGTISTIFSEVHSFEYAGIAENKLILLKDQYFVIGDNYAESKDSRYEVVGIVDKNSIIGKIKDSRK